MPTKFLNKKMVKKIPANTYTYAVGRRKSAIATIKLFSGKGATEVNSLAIEKYFPTATQKVIYEKPFVVTNNLGKFHFKTKISGGGKNGQIEALTLAISRALQKLDTTFTSVLRTSGLLTVDSRVRERRMVGTGGKARRQKQSPKR